MNIEYVRWLDSGTHLHDGWMQLEVVQQQAPACLQEVDTVGHVVFEDDDVIVLGLSVDSNNATVFGAQVIAKSCIKHRATLYVVPPVDSVAA